MSIKSGVEVSKGNFEKKHNFSDGKNVEMGLSKLERNGLSKEIREELQKISNKKFLSYSKEERFRFITKGNLSYNDVKEGDEIVTTFTFDGTGKPNRDLYLLTTAGQVLPDEVREVQVGGEVYTRVGLNGEFFNSKNKRLTIHEGTKIIALKVEDTSKMVKENSKKVESYLKTNSENNGLSDLVKASVDKGISPDLSVLAFGGYIENFKNEEEKKVKIEELLTKVYRLRTTIKDWDGKVGENGKYPDELVLKLLKSYNKDWKKVAKDYGIDESKIVSEENTSKSVTINFEKLVGTNLSGIDLRGLKDKYPREASIKNNNPAGITYNETFARTLDLHGIDYYVGTARPESEGGNYFGFPNMEEGMNAFNLLWEIKMKKMGDKTFGEFARNWAVDYSSYQSQFADVWDKPLNSLSGSVIDIVKSKQMKIESPGMYAELSKINIVV